MVQALLLIVNSEKFWWLTFINRSDITLKIQMIGSHIVGGHPCHPRLMWILTPQSFRSKAKLANRWGDVLASLYPSPPNNHGSGKWMSPMDQFPFHFWGNHFHVNCPLPWLWEERVCTVCITPLAGRKETNIKKKYYSFNKTSSMRFKNIFWLVVEPPNWKICSSNWTISPRFGVNIKTIWIETST